MASNNGVTQEAFDHVRNVLMQLGRADVSDRQDLDVLIRQIAYRSLELSWIRVRDYCRRLKASVNAIDMQGFGSELGTEPGTSNFVVIHEY